MWTEDMYEKAIHHVKIFSSNEDICEPSCSIIIEDPHMTGKEVFNMIGQLNQMIEKRGAPSQGSKWFTH